MDPLLIVKTGTTFASLASECGDFEDWISAGVGLDRNRRSDIAPPLRRIAKRVERRNGRQIPDSQPPQPGVVRLCADAKLRITALEVENG